MQEGLFVLEAFEQTTSTQEVDNSLSLEIFPQPAQQELNLNIQLDKSMTGGQIQIVDMMGRTLYKEEVNLRKGQNDFSIEEINMLASGYYILSVQAEQLRTTMPLIIGR